MHEQAADHPKHDDRPTPSGDASLDGPETAEEVARTRGSRAERFLTWPMAIGFALYALFALTFSLFKVKGDALVYFNLLRRFFGEETDFAYAYQFGSAVWNGPFFLVGKGLGIAFGSQPRIFHVSFEEISITFAANAALVLTLYLGWRILRASGCREGRASSS